ncbi:MAG: M20/M25/M40 family metallo-hydrolase, partial [Candidatus Poribacteria bacterium]
MKFLTISRKLILLIFFFSYLSSISVSDVIYDEKIILNIVRSVNLNNIMQTILDLQENRDINASDKVYKSRYCLRVRDTDNPTDGACDNAGDYIFNKLSSYGLQVEFDLFDHIITDKFTGKQSKYKMRNVISTLKGKGLHSDITFIVCAHYDSFAGLSAGWMWDWGILPAPGADDNASGVAVLLEFARILSQYEFDFTIKFIAFTGEELGMFGSKDYAKKASSRGEKIAGVINIDMIGFDEDKLDIDIIANYDSEWLGYAIEYNQREFGINLVVNKIIDPKMIYSDHSSFWKFGYSAVLVNEGINEKQSKINHTADDTIEKLNPDLIYETTKLIISTIARLADPVTEDNNEINADLAIDIDPTYKSLIIEPQTRVTLKAMIKNLGDENANNITTQIWLIPPELWLQPKLIRELKLNLKPKMFQTIAETININNWGDYQIVIKVNPDYGIFESNYLNNVARALINVTSKYGISDL